MLFHKVLVGVDDRSGGQDAIALARRLAVAPEALVLANVYGTGLLGRTPGALADDRAQAHRLLACARQDNSPEAATVARCDASPGRGLHELTDHEGADLLVVGSSRRGGIGRVLLGDDTLAALNGASCAVAIAPSGYASADSRWSEIGVGDDGSVESGMAVDAARALGSRLHATVRVLSVVSLQSLPALASVPLDWTDATDEAIRAERRRLASIKGITGEVVFGDAGPELARFGTQVQLLVVGSRGSGPLGRLISGSTSNFLARQSPCPLLVVPRHVSLRGRAAPGEPSPGLRAPAASAS